MTDDIQAPEGTQEVGRVMIRGQGEWWTAYYALPDSAEGAIELGRLHMALTEHEDVREAFIATTRAAVAALLAKHTDGATPTWVMKPSRGDMPGGAG